jgi:hypothetical protein
MTARIGALALILSAVALGLAGYALTRDEPQPGRAPVRTDRVAMLERQVAELTREIETLKAERPARTARDAPTLPSLTPRAVAAAVEGAPDDAQDDAQVETALESMVDSAVDRKTKQVLDELRIKADKKPAIDVLAAILELNDHQRARTERVVVEGQREVYGLLETPTADGTNLMDELVEIAARGVAEPGKDHGWFRWIARVAGEKIPGTDTTYAQRIEAVKRTMRETFQREWSEAQYREFTEWGVDPTEIAKIPGSPQAALIERITQRARELGARIPDTAD